MLREQLGGLLPRYVHALDAGGRSIAAAETEVLVLALQLEAARRCEEPSALPYEQVRRPPGVRPCTCRALRALQ